MTMEVIAENITPVGYAAAIIGIALSAFVLLIRFRDRNIARKAAEDAKKVTPPAASAPVDAPRRSSFKTFSPQKDAAAGQTESSADGC